MLNKHTKALSRETQIKIPMTRDYISVRMADVFSKEKRLAMSRSSGRAREATGSFFHRWWGRVTARPLWETV